MASVLLCMFALCSCGNSSDEVNYEQDANLQATCVQAAEVLKDMTPDEAAYYQSYYGTQEGGEIYANLMSQWQEIQPQVGEFVEMKGYTVTKAGKTVSAVQVIAFTERDVKLTYVLNANKGEVTAINVQMVYSLGETMSKAGLNTMMGIGIVFIILILICLVIYCFNIIPVIQKKFSGKNKAETKVAIIEKSHDTSEPQTDDLELIAVIAAAIAMETGASTDDFVVRSIKRRY